MMEPTAIGGGSWISLGFHKLLLLFFLGLHVQHMAVPRPGVKAELQPAAYATATATQDPTPQLMAKLDPLPH